MKKSRQNTIRQRDSFGIIKIPFFNLFKNCFTTTLLTYLPYIIGINVNWEGINDTVAFNKHKRGKREKKSEGIFEIFTFFTFFTVIKHSSLSFHVFLNKTS